MLCVTFWLKYSLFYRTFRCQKPGKFWFTHTIYGTFAKPGRFWFTHTIRKLIENVPSKWNFFDFRSKTNASTFEWFCVIVGHFIDEKIHCNFVILIRFLLFVKLNSTFKLLKHNNIRNSNATLHVFKQCFKQRCL